MKIVRTVHGSSIQMRKNNRGYGGFAKSTVPLEYGFDGKISIQPWKGLACQLGKRETVDTAVSRSTDSLNVYSKIITDGFGSKTVPSSSISNGAVV